MPYNQKQRFTDILEVSLIAVSTLIWGYVGVWLLFVDGINQVLGGFNASPDNVSNIVWGFIRTGGSFVYLAVSLLVLLVVANAVD